MSTLIGDLGGTRLRFALLGEDGAIRRLPVLGAADAPGLAAAVRAALDLAGSPRPARACLAVAGPVAGGRGEVTNRGWTFDEPGLAAATGLAEVRLLNDFEALARALPDLAPEEVQPLGGPAAPPDGPRIVLGPGTGFGQALLVPARGAWEVVPTEGGYVGLPFREERELAVLLHLRRTFPRVSVERVLCGGGLVLLHGALAALDGAAEEPVDPASIVAHGLARGCARCAEALDLFCALLGDAAGNAALATGARGGVWLAGGVAPRLADVLPRSRFRPRFEEKGRGRAYLEAIPTFLVTSADAALRGCAAVARPRTGSP